MENGRNIAASLRGSVTASGGVDLCGPGLLIEAAERIEALEAALQNVLPFVRVDEWDSESERETINALREQGCALIAPPPSAYPQGRP
jgi:hypothetical protein